MKSSYIRKSGHVKSRYTISLNGRVWRVRATHSKIMSFLRALCVARRAA